MVDPPPDGAASWAEVPWSTIPDRTDEEPDRWPTEQEPDERRKRRWRSGAVAGVLVVVGLAPFFLPLQSDEPAALRPVAVSAAVLLALFTGSVIWRLSSQPYYLRKQLGDARLHSARASRKRVLRDLRRRAVHQEDLALARFWVVQGRSAFLTQVWLGFIWSMQLMLAAPRPWGYVVVWLLLGALWVGTMSYHLGHERSLRIVESGHRTEAGAGAGAG